MKKTKIFYLISSLAQGGAERHLLDLVERLDPERYQADICVLRSEVHFTDHLPEGQPRYRLGSRSWFSPFAFARLRRHIRDARPDILHTYLNDGNLWGRLAVWSGPRPRVLTSVHLDDMTAAYRFTERFMGGHTDRTVAHSRKIQHMLCDSMGIPPERVIVIPNGVTPERFVPASDGERSAARALYQLESDQFVAVMAARIAPQKNHDLVIAALAELQRAGALPAGFRLLLAGRVSSAAYDRQVRAAIQRAGLDASGQVRFLGPVRDMQGLYAAADVVLLPSRSEASPIAALEALSAGVPLLLSAAANTDTVMLAGRHGWLIEEPSAPSIAAALREMLSAGAGPLRAMGAAGREHVLAHFTTTRVAQDFMRLYDTLLAEKRA